MNIVKATVRKTSTDDGRINLDKPIGHEYLVDLDTIEESNPTFAGYRGLQLGARLCILTVCEDCRGHYTGKLPLELLTLETAS